MKPQIKFEIALLVSLFGFFIGGIININREIIEIFLSAIIGGIIVFFVVLLLINALFKTEKNQIDNKNKGKKVDITINDTEEIINNYLNK